MEPTPPVVDRAALQLVASKTFAGADFSIQPDGVCRLNSELARRIVQLSSKFLTVSGTPKGTVSGV
jgi:hypothetical protein